MTRKKTDQSLHVLVTKRQKKILQKESFRTGTSVGHIIRGLIEELALLLSGKK